MSRPKPVPALVWLPDVAAYKPNRAALRSNHMAWITSAIIETRTVWAAALAALLVGVPAAASWEPDPGCRYHDLPQSVGGCKEDA
jgi:hypothetical protein